MTPSRMTYHSVPRDITHGALLDGRHRQLHSLTTRSPAPMIWSMRHVGSSVRLYFAQNRARCSEPRIVGKV